MKEPTLESLARGKKVYEPARYMSIKTAIEQLLELEDKLQVRCLPKRIHPMLSWQFFSDHETSRKVLQAFLTGVSYQHGKDHFCR